MVPEKFIQQLLPLTLAEMEKVSGPALVVLWEGERPRSYLQWAAAGDPATSAAALCLMEQLSRTLQVEASERGELE